MFTLQFEKLVWGCFRSFYPSPPLQPSRTTSTLPVFTSSPPFLSTLAIRPHFRSTSITLVTSSSPPRSSHTSALSLQPPFLRICHRRSLFYPRQNTSSPPLDGRRHRNIPSLPSTTAASSLPQHRRRRGHPSHQHLLALCRPPLLSMVAAIPPCSPPLADRRRCVSLPPLDSRYHCDRRSCPPLLFVCIPCLDGCCHSGHKLRLTAKVAKQANFSRKRLFQKL